MEGLKRIQKGNRLGGRTEENSKREQAGRENTGEFKKGNRLGGRTEENPKKEQAGRKD